MTSLKLHARLMLRHMWGWGGWGGVGCNDIVEVARTFDATSHVGLGWVGWGVMTSLKLHARLMLRHMWGWGGWGGVGCN